MLLSLDVSFKNLGWTVFEKGVPVNAGVIVTDTSKKKTTRQADDFSLKSVSIALAFEKLILENVVDGVIGELPTGGSKSARAGKMMCMSNSIVSTVCAVREVPVEWATPNQVKIALAGNRNATKDEMMEKAVQKHKNIFKVDKTGKYPVFKAFGKKWGKGLFEHIADSIGAYLALRNGNLVRMYG